MFKYAAVCCNQPILELKLSYARFSSTNPKLRNKIFEMESFCPAIISSARFHKCISIPDIMKFFLKMIKQKINSVWLRFDYSALDFRLRSQIAKSSSAQIQRSLWNSETLQSPVLAWLLKVGKNRKTSAIRFFPSWSKSLLSESIEKGGM